jgi:tetratricopeptide (TPR) repeat protein
VARRQWFGVADGDFEIESASAMNSAWRWPSPSNCALPKLRCIRSILGSMGLGSMVLILFCSAMLAQDAAKSIAVEGTVRDGQGKPVDGASVTLSTAEQPRLVETQTKADGTFLITWRDAGSFSVRATKSGFRDGVAERVALTAGQTKHLDLVLGGLVGANYGSGSGQSQAKGAAGAPDNGAAAMELEDAPNFTVAGVTDWSNAGLHGSATTSKASDALTRETVELKSENAGTKDSSSGSSPAAVGRSANEAEADRRRLSGDVEERSGNPVAAVGEYERAVRLDPREENYFAWGSELLLHKAPQQAAEVFSTAARKHPNSVRILAGLGAALFASGSYAEAAQRLCQASDLNPDAAGLYLFLGQMEKAANEPLPCAKEKLARFARERPGDASANYYYAVSLWKSERESSSATGARQTEALLESAVRLNPRFAAAYLELGIVRMARGNFAEAILALKKAVELDEGSADAHYQLGLAYKRNGQQTRAEQEFATYKAAQSREAADLERQRRELRQFLIVLKDQATPAPTAPR